VGGGVVTRVWLALGLGDAAAALDQPRFCASEGNGITTQISTAATAASVPMGTAHFAFLLNHPPGPPPSVGRCQL